jgi:hypothetical protein
VYAIVPNGSPVYLGGSFTTLQGLPRGGVAAVDPTSGAPSGWIPAANSTVVSIALDGSRVLVGGSFTNVGTMARNRLAALDATSGIATDWDPNVSGTVWSVAAGDGIFAAGDFTSVGGAGRERVAGFAQQTLDVGDRLRPAGVSLAAPWPNPSRGPVQLAFSLAEAAHVRLRVFDLQGRALATLVDAPLPAGRHEARWNRAGTASVEPGIYFVRCEVGGRGESRRLVIVD